MDKDTLLVKECKNDPKWDDFIIKSFNKNFYSLSDFINLEQNTKKFFILMAFFRET